MSTTSSGPATPVAFRITASGVSHKADPFEGVDQPPSHVALVDPTVGGGEAGGACRVGGADETVFELAGTGLGIVAVGGPSPPTHADAVSAKSVKQHRKTMIFVTGGTPGGVEALGGYRADGRRTQGQPPATDLPPPLPRTIRDGGSRRFIVRLHGRQGRPVRLGSHRR